MFRYTTTSAAKRSSSLFKSALARHKNNQINSKSRNLSSNPLEADSGGLATRAHHAMTLALAGLAPIYMILPEDGSVSRGLGVFLSANIAAHSWIGMNYVCTDYVPKVSKALLGPSRIFNVGLAAVTFIGLTKMSLSSPGGIKGALRGLWNPDKKES